MGEAKATYGTGAFVLFNTGEEVVRSKHGLISTVSPLDLCLQLWVSIETDFALFCRSHINLGRIASRSLRSRDQLPSLEQRSSGAFELVDQRLTFLLKLTGSLPSPCTRLRDQMNIIEKSSDIDRLVSTVKDTGGVYFVTAFSGLLAPYWDSEAGGLLIGISAYTTRAHICRATLEAASFQVSPRPSFDSSQRVD